MTTPSTPLSKALHREMASALRAGPGLEALWLGLRSGVGIAKEGRSQLARHRLDGQAPRALATFQTRAAPGAEQLVLLAPGEAVAAVRVDEEKLLLALARPELLDEAALARLRALAARLAGCLSAWESRLLNGLEGPA